MKKFLITLSLYHLITLPVEATWTYARGRNTLRVTGEGTIGALNDSNAFARYMLRAQGFRTLENGWNIGVVYGIDEFTVEQGFFAKDAFAYVETEYGRAEFGWTEAISTKMGLTLPDVGQTRLNNAPFFLPENFVGQTNPRVFGNQFAWRANFATLPTNPIQVGVGRTFWNQGQAGFNNSTDVALRWRKPEGRYKGSISAGFSYVERPHDFIADAHMPPVFADARYQGTLAGNLQWGSFLWAITGKVIVDDNPIGFRSDGLQVGTGLQYEFLSYAFSANYIYSNVGVFGTRVREEAGGAFTDAGWMNSHTAMASARHRIDAFFSVWASGGVLFTDTIGNHPFVSAGVTARF